MVIFSNSCEFFECDVVMLCLFRELFSCMREYL